MESTPGRFPASWFGARRRRRHESRGSARGRKPIYARDFSDAFAERFQRALRDFEHVREPESLTLEELYLIALASR